MATLFRSLATPKRVATPSLRTAALRLILDKLDLIGLPPVVNFLSLFVHSMLGKRF